MRYRVIIDQILGFCFHFQFPYLPHSHQSHFFWVLDCAKLAIELLLTVVRKDPRCLSGL